MLPGIAAGHIELAGGEVDIRAVFEAHQNFAGLNRRIQDPHFNGQNPISDLAGKGIPKARFENHPHLVAAFKSNRRRAADIGLEQRVLAVGAVKTEEAERPFEGPAVAPVPGNIAVVAGQHEFGMIVDRESSTRAAATDVNHSVIGLFCARIKRTDNRNDPGKQRIRNYQEPKKTGNNGDNK